VKTAQKFNFLCYAKDNYVITNVDGIRNVTDLFANYMLKDFTCRIGAEVQLLMAVESFVRYKCGYVSTFLRER
jgi:hypothetical protein